MRAEMEASARRVKAERDRNRLPKRGPWSRWTRRIAGLAATGAFVAVGVVSAQMILPDPESNAAAVVPTATPTATPKAKKSEKKKPKKPKGLTKAQRQAREDAVDAVRAQGFTTLKASDYDPKAKLRVLIGRPVGDAAGGHTAFFFTKNGFIGKDAEGTSTVLKLSKATSSTVTLTYGVFRPGEDLEPSGRKKVRFKLQGDILTPLDEIPLQTERFQRRNG
jgi:hypothetical protein